MGLDLLTPEAHAGAYEWAAVLLAHFTVGLVLVAAVAALLNWLSGDDLGPMHGPALVIVVLVYFFFWEGLGQRYAAGLPDAAIDTFAVAMGGLVGISAWLRKGGAVLAAIIATAIVAVAGIWRRKE